MPKMPKLVVPLGVVFLRTQIESLCRHGAFLGIFLGSLSLLYLLGR